MYQRQKAFLLKTAYAAAVLAVGWLILRYALVWLLPFLLALGFAALIRAVLGPRFTDRIIAINMVNTMVVAIIALLSVYLREDFLVDVALVYGLLSFLMVAVLAQMVTIRSKRRKLKQKERGASHGT